MASISASRTLVGAGATPPLLRLISFGSRTYALRIFFQNSSSPAKSSGAACAYARFRSEASITASAPYRNSRRLTSALILINSHHSFRPQAYRNQAAFGDLLGPFSLPRLTPATPHLWSWRTAAKIGRASCREEWRSRWSRVREQ